MSEVDKMIKNTNLKGIRLPDVNMKTMESILRSDIVFMKQHARSECGGRFGNEHLKDNLLSTTMSLDEFL